MHSKRLASGFGVFAAAVALFTISGNVVADDGVETVTIDINYADLDLDTNKGVKRLHARLRRAARHACDVRPVRETGSLAVSRAAKACYERSLAAAIRKIDNERLTALVYRGADAPSS